MISILIFLIIAVVSSIKINYFAIIGILLGATMILVVGIIDDIKRVKPYTKLFVQIAAAGIAIYFGVKIEFITNPIDGVIPLRAFVIPITILWIVGITNAINLVDGLDGLASGIAAIAGVTLFIVALIMKQEGPAVLMIALAGVSFGFLRYNFNPASIFLGDSGSLFLGYILATSSVLGVLKSALLISFIVPVLVFGFPIMDTALAIFRRMRDRKHIFEADKFHIHHNLLEAGLSHREAVMAIYFACILLSLGALAMTAINDLVETIVVISIIILVAAVGIIRVKINLDSGNGNGLKIW
ncbi:MAG: MraY family glycosyltransferase [Candidatus Saganbacteria bacterium]|nr:MraY family glycosyltransferase [Candidatus Saganbacteria bacterium]